MSDSPPRAKTIVFLFTNVCSEPRTGLVGGQCSKTICCMSEGVNGVWVADPQTGGLCGMEINYSVFIPLNICV